MSEVGTLSGCVSNSVGSVSIVVEWDNAGDIPDDTSLANIRTLAERIVEARSMISGAPVLVMVNDPLESSRDAFQAMILEIRRSHSDRIDIIALDTPDSLYVDQKIAGLEETETEIIAFADSDCVYRENWLMDLLKPFSVPDVDFTYGRNFMMTDEIWGNAAAIYWFYPIEQERAPRKPGIYFNNLAIRREAFRRHPFPGRPGNRLACAIWCSGLPASYLNGAVTKATALHPPAYGFAGVYRRAQEYGCIDDGRYAARGFNRSSRLLRGLLRLIREILHSARCSISVAPRMRINLYGFLRIIGVSIFYSVTTGLWQIRAALFETPNIPKVTNASPTPSQGSITAHQE